MRRLLLLALLVPALAPAWNHVGHKAVAGLAYDLLTPAARTRVDALIAKHPDYEKWLAVDAPQGAAARARHAFIQASYWPDTIKGDLRFYDESRRDEPATPTLPGFPDMKRRTNWHYINIAFSPDGTPFPPPPPVNALTQINMILGVLEGKVTGTPEADPTYLLPWLLHLVGDVHNPMHCTSRWKKDQVDPRTGKPWSDLGGNGVYVVGSFNLHAFWDDALGITDTPGFVNGLVQFLSSRGKDGSTVLEPQTWITEGARLAETVCYNYGSQGAGTRENPVTFSSEYIQRARELARERAALAGRRLAGVLNARLQ